MSWGKWKELYPDSEVLNLDTGHKRDYQNLPYQEYFQNDQTIFPYPKHRSELPAKSWVAGVNMGGINKAYPLHNLATGQWLGDTIGDWSVKFRYEPENKDFQIVDSLGNRLPSVQAYWFAWQAFNPDTLIWEGQGQ